MKKNKSMPVTDGLDGKPRVVSMILKLTVEQHAWVKAVAEATNQTQPHVVNYILEQVSKSPTSDYIEEIGKIHKTKLLAEIRIKEAQFKEQRQKLEQDLNLRVP